MAKVVIREYMKKRPMAPFCSVCGRAVPEAGKDAKAVVCSRCTVALADRRAKRLAEQRATAKKGGK